MDELRSALSRLNQGPKEESEEAPAKPAMADEPEKGTLKGICPHCGEELNYASEERGATSSNGDRGARAAEAV